MAQLKIGIIFDFSRKWMGGIYYYKSLIRSFSFIENKNQPKIFLFIGAGFEEYVEDLEYQHLVRIKLETSIQSNIPNRFIKSILFRKNLFHCELSEKYDLDGIYAVNDYPVRVDSNSKTKVAAWIPDLQHDFFPQFFDFKRRIFRKIRLSYMLKNATNLIVSSNDVKKNFYEAFNIPDTLKIHTIRFSSINNPQIFDKDILEKYGVKDEYFIVCNQFLQHKNHIVILEALKLAIKVNPKLIVVITGNTNAYRQKNYFDELLTYIKENALESNVVITGLIPREDQLTLIKFSKALIQPSKFEGWSTSIEDAKSLGVPVIASKLNVHIEQLKGEAIYFHADDYENLSNVLLNYNSDSFKYKNDYEESICQFANDFLNVFNGHHTSSAKILHINASIGEGSTGRIFKKISDLSFANGFISYLAYGRWNKKSKYKNHILIGGKINLYIHGLYSYLFDKHGFGSILSTLILLRKIKLLKPDLIQIHSLHGYYINIGLLFKFLKRHSEIKVVWTQHDCWSFTGHCAHYEDINCVKFESICYECPKSEKYPKSLIIDNSKNNYLRKKEALSMVPNLQLVAPSNWLLIQYRRSFLKGYNSLAIHNGIDLEVFRPHQQYELNILRHKFLINRKVILGVSNAWSKAKGFEDLVKLAIMLGEEYLVVLVGIERGKKQDLPANVFLVSKTENIQELSKWYSLADVFVNPTYLDTFPTTNLEALACGTPVITYKSGGSPEAVDQLTGAVIERGDIDSFYKATVDFSNKNRYEITVLCRKRAENYFSDEIQFTKYISLYKQLLTNGK